MDISGFSQKNEILFKAPILQGSKITGEPDPFEDNRCTTLASADVIDINKSGKPEVEISGYMGEGGLKQFTEPVLKTPLNDLKAFGEEQNKRVITQGDLDSELKIADGFGSWDEALNRGMGNTRSHGQERTMNDLVQQLVPDDKDAKWAIDLASSEFLIYRPK